MKDVQQRCYIISVELVSCAQISNLILNCAGHEKNFVGSAQIMYFVRVI